MGNQEKESKARCIRNLVEKELARSIQCSSSHLRDSGLLTGLARAQPFAVNGHHITFLAMLRRIVGRRCIGVICILALHDRHLMTGGVDTREGTHESAIHVLPALRVSNLLQLLFM